MTLKEQIKGSFPSGVGFPGELAALCDWAEDGRDISGGFRLLPDKVGVIKKWFGHDRAAKYFGAFAHDYDGSVYAIWQPEGQGRKVVFLGSEGEPLLVLADDFVDFLRLLAIGYDEIGFSDLSEPPEENVASEDFAEWVREEFGVGIPETGAEIVDVDDRSFEDWVGGHIGG